MVIRELCPSIISLYCYSWKGIVLYGHSNDQNKFREKRRSELLRVRVLLRRSSSFFAWGEATMLLRSRGVSVGLVGERVAWTFIVLVRGARRASNGHLGSPPGGERTNLSAWFVSRATSVKNPTFASCHNAPRHHHPSPPFVSPSSRPSSFLPIPSVPILNRLLTHKIFSQNLPSFVFWVCIETFPGFTKSISRKDTLRPKSIM